MSDVDEVPMVVDPFFVVQVMVQDPDVALGMYAPNVARSGVHDFEVATPVAIDPVCPAKV